MEEQADGTRARKQASVVVSTADKSKTIAAIGEALNTKGWWEVPTAPAKPADSNLEHIALAWVRWKIGTRGVASNTRKNITANLNRWFKALRSVLKLKADDVVPGSAMTAANVAKVGAVWRAKYAESTIYQTLASVADMWRWRATRRTTSRRSHRRPRPAAPGPIGLQTSLFAGRRGTSALPVQRVRG